MTHMRITVEPNVSDYYILEIAVPVAMLAIDPWGHEWFPEIDKWCNDSFGKQDMWGADPESGWKRMRNKYFFTAQDMCTMFVLKWA